MVMVFTGRIIAGIQGKIGAYRLAVEPNPGVQKKRNGEFLDVGRRIVPDNVVKINAGSDPHAETGIEKIAVDQVYGGGIDVPASYADPSADFGCSGVSFRFRPCSVCGRIDRRLH